MSNPSNSVTIWRIENFTKHTARLAKTFSLRSINFCMDLYPKEFCDHVPGFVLIRVYLANNKQIDRNFEAQYRLEVLDKDGNSFQSQICQIKNDKGNMSYPYLYIYQDYLLRNAEELLPKDVLTLKCSIEFEKSIEKFPENRIEDHEHKILSENLKNLLLNPKHSDVTILVGGKVEFKLHKNILSVRSPVFAAMFDCCDFEENQKNRVEIPDLDVEVFEELIQFIYTGRIPLMEKFALELFVASDKYQIESLKTHCERSLSASLDSKNVINILLFADAHQSVALKRDCINFITQNAKLVKADESWKQLKGRADLLEELYDELCEAKFDD